MIKFKKFRTKTLRLDPNYVTKSGSGLIAYFTKNGRGKCMGALGQ